MASWLRRRRDRPFDCLRFGTAMLRSLPTLNCRDEIQSGTTLRTPWAARLPVTRGGMVRELEKKCQGSGPAIATFPSSNAGSTRFSSPDGSSGHALRPPTDSVDAQSRPRSYSSSHFRRRIPPIRTTLESPPPAQARRLGDRCDSRNSHSDQRPALGTLCDECPQV